MNKRVAIFGGGVGALSAAHELVQRGFAVEVFEAKDVVGGKARSIPVDTPPEESPGRADALPGEHGFRFFPGFYRHLTATMREIPLDANGKKRVADNLVTTSVVQIARQGDEDMMWPAQFPDSVRHLYKSLDAIGIPEKDALLFFTRLVVFLTSSEERRLTEYERQSWQHFSQVMKAQDPGKYAKYFAGGLTRSLVAARADKMSARTGGAILLQLLFDLSRPGGQADRVLNGPTSDAWINPWQRWLSDPKRWTTPNHPVTFHTAARVSAIDFDQTSNRITGVTITRRSADGETTERRADFDYYVAALPVEVIAPLLTDPMKRADPSLAGLDRLETEWMNGLQFYLAKHKTREPAPALRKELDKSPALNGDHVLGHTLYIDSRWALTSISQLPFFRQSGYDPPPVAGQKVERVLSVDISDWDTPDASGCVARRLKREQVKEGIWQQMKDHLNDNFMEELHDEDLLHWFLDPAIRETDQGLTNDEPLLINTVSSWGLRPEAVTAIPNLFLAADYVRTNTDLATMEAANEAARRAVNGILEASGYHGRRCRIWPLQEPWVFLPLKWYDRCLFRKGRPHAAWIAKLAKAVAVPLWRFGRFFWWVFWWLIEIWWWLWGLVHRG
jgi:uncharacterized protein with NAD-binding domain and iron-sulfur cluster